MTQPNWGRDLKTVQVDGNVDLTPGMVESTGRDLLAESLIRRQTTPRGSVIDAPNDCFDLRSYLNDAITASQARIQQMQNQIVQELRKDQRVNNVTVSVKYFTAEKRLQIVENVSSSEGPFTMTFSIQQDGAVSVLVSDITQRQ